MALYIWQIYFRHYLKNLQHFYYLTWAYKSGLWWIKRYFTYASEVDYRLKHWTDFKMTWLLITYQVYDKCSVQCSQTAVPVFGFVPVGVCPFLYQRGLLAIAWVPVSQSWSGRSDKRRHSKTSNWCKQNTKVCIFQNCIVEFYLSLICVYSGMWFNCRINLFAWTLKHVIRRCQLKLVTLWNFVVNIQLKKNTFKHTYWNWLAHREYSYRLVRICQKLQV